MQRLHPVFNVVKLTPAPEDLFPGRKLPPSPPLVIVEGEEEWEVEEILDSQLMRQKLKFLVKWKGFGHEHNSWEDADDVHAPELVQEFYKQHPSAPQFIQALQFNSIHFQTSPPITSSRRDPERGIDVRGPPKVSENASSFSQSLPPLPSIPLSPSSPYMPSSKCLCFQQAQSGLSCP